MVITLNGTDFTIYLNWAVCFFPYVWLIVFYNDNEQAALSTVCAHAALEQSLDFFPLLTVEANSLLLLFMKIIGIVKGLLLFVYIHNKN